ncbi:hypothetical protein JCM19231_3514 [Vibrio ishigakensis]|uniref:Polymer-forming cytoskeletal protein n=1 Tax=Vibrio ishigakensis TaxID=1481914 RepID=A0A0B8NTD0_9VIBR|nr:hypothetical protein [Vibrio ishigakensis]GAM53994.1 hypothetical protein JCM19231_3514 [Vibrio ishigakensis]
MVEQGNILGDLIVSDRYELLGMCTGNVIVQRNSVLYLYGIVSKSITLEPGSKAFIQGIVGGDIINNGGHYSITGSVLGNIIEPSEIE